MEFEDILVQVGDFGKYQRDLMLYFLLPASALLPFFAMNILFLLSVPDHWCNVPELNAYNLTMEQKKALIAPPWDPKCSMYDVNYTDILSSSSSNWSVPADSKTKSCYNGWHYDTTNHDSTAATQWNLVCSDRHYVSMLLTMATVGSIIGTPIYGALSDKVGRKPIFFLTVFVACVAGLTSVIMTNFNAFLVLRIINGTIMPSIFQLPYIILLEIVGPTMRSRMNVIANASWTFGLCLMPLVAWLCHGWFIFGLASSSVTLVFLLYFKLLPESPRWFLSQGKYEEAAKVMQQIGKKNGKEIELGTLTRQLEDLGERIKKESELKTNSDETSPKVFFTSPKLRKNFCILTLCCLADIASYNGLQLNSSNLDGNEFLNFFLLAIAELPGYLISWLFMEKIGRRWDAVWTFVLTGLACMMPIISRKLNIVASLVGKFGAAAAFIVTYQQCSELFPTSVRALGMGASGTIAEVAMFGLPYIVYLGKYGEYIPFMIIGLICLFAGFFVSFLPETRNSNLPQTVLDAEKFGGDQKYFSMNRRRPSCYGYDPRPQQGKTRSRKASQLSKL